MFKKPAFIIGVLLWACSITVYAAGISSGGGNNPEKPGEVAPLQTMPVRPLQIDQFSSNFPQADAILYSDYTTYAYINVLEMLVGRVAGVWVSGGFFHYTVRIRNATGPPLVVIDHMPFPSYSDSDLNSLLQTIPPQDVDRIEIIKNLCGAARYGPNAGNGVIVIHTKRGDSEFSE